MNRFKFTKTALQTLPPSTRVSKSGKPAPEPYYDTEKPGLMLRITHKGTITFFTYTKIARRPEYILIGRFPKVSVQAARDAHKLNMASITLGVNPNEEKRQGRAELSFSQLFTLFMKHRNAVATTPAKKRGAKKEQELYDNHMAKPLGRKRAASLKPALADLHGQLVDTPYQANRMLALVSKCYSWARDARDLPLDNPTRGIDRYAERSRDRFLNAAEMQAFFDACEREGGWAADYFKLALFTGARRNNVSTMRWDALDFNAGTWTITDTKNGSTHTVPLVRPALDILWRRRAFEPRTDSWVFPSPRSKSGHVEEPRKPFERICEAAGLVDIRLHDLRRSMGSWLAAAGTSDNITGKALGHKSVAASRVYARLNLDPVRAAMEQAAAAMQGADDE